MLTLLYRQLKPGRMCRCRTLTTAPKWYEKTKSNENTDNIDNETNKRIEDTHFAKEFYANRIPITDIQRFILSAGSSVAALLNPRRHDMIACLGETTGHDALNNMLSYMKSNTEGMKILQEQPRINTKTVDLEALGRLEENKFGYQYYKFLKDNVSEILFSKIFHNFAFNREVTRNVFYM